MLPGRAKPWLRWIGVGIGVVGTLVTLAWSLFAVPAGVPAWQQWLVAVAITALYWFGNLLLRFGLRRRLPDNEHTARRLLLQAPLTGGLIAGLSAVHAQLLLGLGHGTAAFEPLYWQALWSGLLASVVIISLYEGGHFFYALRMASVRALELERDSALSRLEALKQQVDPHFLFNSLNTMAALIGDNPRAQDFLGSLANVYRYVLLSKDSATVPLSQEMAFVDAYLHLNNVRFRDGLEVVQDLAPASLHLHVPPLAVQLLLENALKHNVISARRPLRISIRAGEGVLRVTNTVQPKTILEQSTRQGLPNIVSRYHLLTDREVVIAHRAGQFEVTLPLLPAA